MYDPRAVIFSLLLTTYLGYLKQPRVGWGVGGVGRWGEVENIVRQRAVLNKNLLNEGMSDTT